MDDALSARHLADGGVEVGVHIADVGHFVRAVRSMQRNYPVALLATATGGGSPKAGAQGLRAMERTALSTKACQRWEPSASSTGLCE